MRRVAGLLASAVVLAVTAGALGSLALFALAVGLLLVMPAAGLSVALAAWRLKVTRWVAQHELSEDQPVHVSFQVAGLGRLPLPVRLEAQVDTDRWVPLGARGGGVELTVGRRGAFQLAPSRLRLRDDMGIFGWSLLAGQPEPLLLLPTADPTAPIPPRLDQRAGNAELDGLQPYVPGTPLSRIAWPALARGAGLQQRRLAPPTDGLPLVLVDTADTGDVRAVDWAARAAAGAILRLVGAGGCRVLLGGDQAATTVTDTAATWHRVYRRLALLEPGSPGAGQGPLGAGRVPDLHIRAAHAPAQALRQPPPPLPPGVMAVADKRRADP
jgi:uncharacterized protein (DUF58 family)